MTALADNVSGMFVGSSVVLDPVFGDATTETGFTTFSMTFATGGTFTLGIGVVDTDDDFLPSGLLVDNVQLTTPSQVVPAPSGLVLAWIGIASLGGYCARRKAR